MEQAIADALQHRWTTTFMAPANLPQPWNLNDPDLAA
jgi:hypothetical protein